MKIRTALPLASMLVVLLGVSACDRDRQAPPEEPLPPATSPPAIDNSPAASTGLSSSTDLDSNRTRQPVSDAAMVSLVKQQLDASGVSTSGMSVTVENGTVTLDGTVSDQSDIAKARSAAMSVRGVTTVETSGLRVLDENQDQNRNQGQNSGAGTGADTGDGTGTGAGRDTGAGTG